jgi:hypothetical protein
MRIHTAFTLASFCAATLLATSASATGGTAGMEPQPTISVLSGGVGDAGMSAIEHQQDKYNLKLIFAENNGDYVANVNVQVHDRHGNLVANTNSPGPILLMSLPKGAYTVSSNEDGVVSTQKVYVHSGHPLKTYIMHFASNDAAHSTLFD